jgi:iron(III) transport system ATP-binding protein
MNFVPVDWESEKRVRLGEAILDVNGQRPMANATATLCIRPEDIQIRGVVVGQGNSVTATIAQMEFLGSFCRAELRLVCGRRLHADFSINAMRDLSLAPGQDLHIALPADRIRLFPVPASAPSHHG